MHVCMVFLTVVVYKGCTNVFNTAQDLIIISAIFKVLHDVFLCQLLSVYLYNLTFPKPVKLIALIQYYIAFPFSITSHNQFI